MRFSSLLAISLTTSGVVAVSSCSAGPFGTDTTCDDTATCRDKDSGTAGSAGMAGNAGTAGAAGNAGIDGGGCDRSKSPAEQTCLVSEQYGVFVSAQNGDDASGTGTRSKPYKTITRAITAATADNGLVFACADGGAYAETIAIDASFDGSGLFGGFKCSDWTYSTELKAKITAPTPTAFKIENLTKGLTLENFHVVAADAVAPGGSSIGVWVSSSSNITLRRTELNAGKGANGSAGVSGISAAPTGQPGAQGNNACEPIQARRPPATVCVNGAITNSVGGRGGEGALGFPTSGGNGEMGHPQSSQGGLPGVGQVTAANMNCNFGIALGGAQIGAPGLPGGAGSGAKTLGTLAPSGYTTASGTPGTSGEPGQGGGGGGGARAPADADACGGPSAAKIGASGGSGGGGGCGGKAGEGGQGGGASIALVSIDSSVTLEQSKLMAQSGGKGGNGGAGQAGGGGGRAGYAGSKYESNASDACEGGKGGQGGSGGPGGGGAGGPSIGVAFVGMKPARGGSNVALSTSPSTGGLDGTGASSGPGAGAAGILAEEQIF